MVHRKLYTHVKEKSMLLIFCLEYTAHSSLYDEIKHQIGVFSIIKEKWGISDSILY